MNFSVTADGTPTSVEYTNPCSLKSSTETDLSVTSFYFQDQVDVSDNLIVVLGGRHDTFDVNL